VVAEEVAAKDAKRAVLSTQMAKFPLDRTLESYAFTLQPSLDRRLMAELETGHYLANAINILLLGPPGAWIDASGHRVGAEGNPARL
jgi:DNA replication protein DnaC